MSRKRHLFKSLRKNLSKIKISRNFISAIKKRLVWLLRTIFLTNKRRGSANAGFVLPTVAMISIVAVLTTTAILYRSFDRAQNASNVRVNQAVLTAAMPAIDRGRAKLDKLFQDTTLPRITPTDDQLYDALAKDDDKLKEYTFGDETPITLTDPGDSNNKLKTAWRFPVDSDNNGKFDSYTLYGIYFRTPPVGSNNKYTRARNTLEGRTSPMVLDQLDAKCAATIPSLIAETGWVRQNNDLKKSFFVYTATVPITIPPNDTNFEEYTGNQSFAAVEYQQDRIQNPNSYLVIYNDDVRIDTDSNVNKLNGAVFTNGNILNSSVNSGQITLHQVSSTNSCVYKAANAKITVGGNVALSGSDAQIHLFQGKGTAINNTDLLNSVNEDDNDTAYNNRAYEDRIQALVNEQMGKTTSTDPTEVTNGIKRRKEELKLVNSTADDAKLRREQLEFYFRKRTRRVPFAEVVTTETISGTVTQGSGDTLRPIDKWIYPIGNDELSLNINGDSLEPKATEPDELRKQGGKEQELGDRVIVGNNLPQIWWDNAKGRFVGPGIDDTQEISGVKWDKPTGNNDTRTRRSAVRTLDDNIAFTERDGQWEVDAATRDGLRIVTGAGIYLGENATPSSFSDADKTIWPDTNPVPGTGPTRKSIKPYWLYSNLYQDITGTSDPNQLDYDEIEYIWQDLTDTNKPRLRMRATAVYGLAPNPICVSSYYVPTNSTTAKNISTLPWKNATGGLSNNGIVYGELTANFSTYQNLLRYQADLTYPNGHSVDDGLLTRALAKTANRTLAEQSAIDAQLCAVQILSGGTPNNSVIPHGAIREIAFLDPREVRENSNSGTAQTYDMPINNRKPVEIRTTVLDLELLRPRLPKSGLIYATRNDALLDKSNNSAKISPVDYKLDPNRRPNGIMLEKGAQLWGATYDPEEKGFVLATNLPAYIKGDFNLHTQGEEFTETLDGNWDNFYTRSTINQNFGCRNGDPSKPGCTTSDTWRPASIIADAVTILSHKPAQNSNEVDKGFREGFRNEGDYDWILNPNILQGGKILPPGFSEYNNFLTSYKWYDPEGVDDLQNRPLGIKVENSQEVNYFSSYLNNFVTPINLRVRTGTYLTELCIIPTGETRQYCNDDPLKWQILISNSCNANTSNDGDFLHGRYNGSPTGTTGGTTANRMKTGFSYEDSDTWDQSGGCFAGQNVVRRLAFLRNKSDGSLAVPPLRVWGAEEGSTSGTGNIGIFNFGSDTSINGKKLQNIPGQPDQTIPWLDPNTFEPVLQIKHPFARAANNIISGTGSVTLNTDSLTSGQDQNWLQPAADGNTIVNAVIITRDSPANPTEKNGGLLNLVRYMENWHPPARQGVPAGARVNQINGSFGQAKNSAYATAPFTAVNSGPKYAITLDGGERTGYLPPTRNWSYDVGLLTQQPDLLSEKMPTPPLPQLPDEYFREVSRSDRWVETLLCGKDGAAYAINDPKQRPANCQS
jgi:hypothetical protein